MAFLADPASQAGPLTPPPLPNTSFEQACDNMPPDDLICQDPLPQFVFQCELDWDDGCVITFRYCSGNILCKAHGRVSASDKISTA